MRFFSLNRGNSIFSSEDQQPFKSTLNNFGTKKSVLKISKWRVLLMSKGSMAPTKGKLYKQKRYL